MTIIRILLNFGIYHVYNRGQNKMAIFETSTDNEVFLSLIRKAQTIYNFQVYGYSIMKNHYHLLFKDVGKQLPEVIGLIQENYAIYYNAKYNHSGAVFMKPFKSKPVYTKGHFFSVFSYILNNPVKAGITADYTEYKWNSPLSGYEKYNITDYLYVRAYYKPVAGLSLHEYILKRSRSKKISDIDLESLSDEEAKELFLSIVAEISGSSEFSSNNITKKIQSRIITQASYLGITMKQLSDLTGMTKTSVFRMKLPLTYI